MDLRRYMAEQIVHVERALHGTASVLDFLVDGGVVVFGATKVFEILYYLEGVAIYNNVWERDDLASVEFVGVT